MVAGLGVWRYSHAISAETSTFELRAKARGIGWLTTGGSSALSGIVLPYIFNTDKGDLGAKTGFIYCGLCAVGLVVSYFCVQELKGGRQLILIK